MLVSQHGLVDIALQPIVALSIVALLVFHLDVDNHDGGDDKRHAQHAQIDSVAGDVPRPVSGNIGKGSDESGHVCNHDLGTGASGANVMRREVVGQPSHNKWRAREDASCDEKGTRVVDVRLARGDEKDVADDGQGDACEHERPTCTGAVRKVTGQEDGDESAGVGRNSEELGVHSGVAERFDDGGEEERVGVDRGDDGEEVE